MKKARFGTWANKCEYFARENSGFRIYNLARVVLREWLQATKKCFKLGHSGTRGSPGHQHRSNIRRQGTGKSRQAGGCAIIRTFAIQSIKVMASKRDGGFECGEKKNGNKNRQVIQVMLVERTKPMVQMVFIWFRFPMEWNWFENSGMMLSDPKNDAIICHNYVVPKSQMLRAAVTGRPLSWGSPPYTHQS